MPQFTYVGDDGRYYPDLGVTANAGDVVEFDEAPADGRWQTKSGELVEPTPAAEPAPETPVETPAPEPTNDGDAATDTPGGK